jgi:retinol dehydrogenase-12
LRSYHALLSPQLVLAMGVGYFVNTMYKQGFPPKAQWGVDDIPDLTGRVIVVTGGYSGIGYETVKVGPAPARRRNRVLTGAQALLAHNAKVYIAGRSEEKARAAIAQLRDVTKREAVFVELDLGSLASVKRAAETLATKEPAIHVLFNNA